MLSSDPSSTAIVLLSLQTEIGPVDVQIIGLTEVAYTIVY